MKESNSFTGAPDNEGFVNVTPLDCLKMTVFTSTFCQVVVGVCTVLDSFKIKRPSCVWKGLFMQRKSPVNLDTSYFSVPSVLPAHVNN